MGAYNAALAAYLWWRGRGARRSLPERIGAGDIALMAVSTYKLSRLISKGKITAPLRAPFTEYEGNAGRAEVEESPAGQSGPRRIVGELLACPFCLDQWVASAFAIGLVEAPRATRFVMSTFTTVAASDLLQIAYKSAETSLEQPLPRRD
jgi:hypothetical protein